MLARIRNGLIARRRQIGLAVLSGVFYAAAFPGYEQWIFGWVAFVPLLWALDDDTLSAWQALGLGWAAGATAHLAVYTWIVGMLRDFGGLPVPLAVLGYVLLCLAQSGLFAVFAAGTHLVTRRLGVSLAWSAPVVMVVAEFCYPALFPSYFANTQYRQLTLIQSTDLWGVLGLGFLLTLCSSSLYQVLARIIRHRGRTPWSALAVFIVVMIFDVVYGVASISNTDAIVEAAPKKVRIGLVQVNMGIYDKTQNPAEGLRRHRQQSLEVERQGAQLILWPESGYYYAIRDSVTNVAGTVLGPISTPLIFGGLRVQRAEDESKHVFNTAFLSDSNGNLLGTYDKTFLLAFGEYLPFGDWIPALYDLSPNTSKFDFGTRTDPLVYDGVKYGVLICYEDILPRFVQKTMKHAPDVLLNLTNDAWFGPTREPLIHMALATFRAVEHRRYLVRSTNTGISAFIDPVGRILGATPVFARANSVHDVASLQIHTVYESVGDLVFWLCLATIALWAALAYRATRTLPKPQ